MTKSTRSFLFTAAIILSVPALTGAKGKGCAPPEGETAGAGGSSGDSSSDGSSGSGGKIGSAAPNMAGTYAVSYEDNLNVEIELGGEVYTHTLGPNGGTISVTHDGEELEFDLDCSKPLVVCPSEVLASTVEIRQDSEIFPREIWMKVPEPECLGELTAADPEQCGEGTNNPECEDVCDSNVEITTAEALGAISQDNDRFGVLLRAGIASNGYNCVLLGGSFVDGQLNTSGSAAGGDWAVDSADGEVVTQYSGGCVWINDANVTGGVQGAIAAATVRFSTNFTAERQ